MRVKVDEHPGVIVVLTIAMNESTVRDGREQFDARVYRRVLKPRESDVSIEATTQEEAMNARARRMLIASSMACTVACAPVLAQTPPVAVVRNGVSYVTGGVGEDEVLAFRQAASQYSLRMTFADKAGHYLSDVHVMPSYAGRVVLMVRTDGPFLFVKVPAGRYEIVARDEYASETRHISVPSASGVDVRIYFPDWRELKSTEVCNPCLRREGMQ